MRRDQLCNHVLKRFIQLILVLVDHICTRTTSAFAQLGNYSPLYEIVYRPLRLRSQQVMINVGMTCYVHTSDISKSKTSPSFHFLLLLIQMHQRAKVYDPTLSYSKVGRFLIAMFTSFLVILATLLPLLFKFGLTSPISQGDTNYYPSPYPDPSPCVGNCSHIHDPSIFYEDGTYWRFSTSGNIAVATAPSLKGPWTYKGPLLIEGTKIRVAPDQDIWVTSSSLHEYSMRY